MEKSLSYNRDGTVTLREGDRELVLEGKPTNEEVERAALSFFTPDEDG